MISANSTNEERLRYPVKVRTKSGKPAKVYEDDAPIAIATDSGPGEGFIENKGEYEENGVTGTSFDVVIQSKSAGASTFTLKADADADAGEVRELSEQWVLNTTAAEAGTMEIGAPIVEPIPA